MPGTNEGSHTNNHFPIVYPSHRSTKSSAILDGYITGSKHLKDFHQQWRLSLIREDIVLHAYKDGCEVAM
jgi:hypothetical protein